MSQLGAPSGCSLWSMVERCALTSESRKVQSTLCQFDDLDVCPNLPGQWHWGPASQKARTRNAWSNYRRRRKRRWKPASCKALSHSESEVTKELGTHWWLAIRRFVIKQGQKFSLSMTHWKPISERCLQLNDQTKVARWRLRDVDGSACFEDGRPFGKCLDLSKAYKQPSPKPPQEAVRDSSGSGKSRYYISLIFGSTAGLPL